ncbi:MAG: hypothetical protein N2489_00855 [Clostridia bacterium]|nr:hypothetical protein [Clostridia bacterium]
MFNKRINVFTGHFGSGKTEVAVNYALQMAKRNEKTAIVDFDIVNPYFRTTDARAILEENNIRTIIPMFANTNVDVPALPPEVNSLFQSEDFKVVLDVGGDDLGARVLSRYMEEISNGGYEMFFVVNVNRPMTDTPQKIEEMIASIEESSRLKVTSLVNNTNLLQFTTWQDIMEGHKLIEKASQKLGIPIAFISCMEENCGSVAEHTFSKVLLMDKNIRLPWDNIC